MGLNQKERRIPRALKNFTYANALSRDIAAQAGFIRLYQALQAVPVQADYAQADSRKFPCWRLLWGRSREAR